jgi:hypothetical protein
MADISAVEEAVASLAVDIIYPEGLDQPSIAGVLCRVYRGWPNSGTLTSDLSSGTVNVTVNADNESGRTTTRYNQRWTIAPTEPGTVATVEGIFLTISGRPRVGDVVGAMINGKVSAYRVQVNDTCSLVAANLGRLIAADCFIQMRGTTITIPSARSLVARTVCDGKALFESRRQEKDVRIACWCPSPLLRDEIASAIDLALSERNFLTLTDLTDCRITYRNTFSFDQSQNALLYRRDLVYTFEYPTIANISLPSMLFGASDLNTNITYG